MSEPRNFLIVKYSSLGDIVNSIPAVRLLRRARPEAKIYWLIRAPFAGLLKHSNFIDKVIVYEGDAGVAATRKAIRDIKPLDIDVALDLQGLFKSGLISYMSGAKERISIPYTRELSSIFYTKKMGKMRFTGIHAVEENVSIIEAYTGQSIGGGYNFDFTIPAEASDKAVLLMKEARRGGAPVVVACPTTRWNSKMPGQYKFALACDKLADKYGSRTVLTGARGDYDYIEGVRKLMKSESYNLAGATDIITLAAVLKGSDVVITCDSGAMHVAAAVGANVVAIFGPTNPDYVGPFTKKRRVVQRVLDCRECRKRDCSDHKCMDAITPDDMAKAASELLEESSKR